MRLLDWIGGSIPPPPQPRTYDEIRAAIAQRDADPLRRMRRAEASLLALTAEVGLDDLRRRLEAIRRG